VKTYSSTNELIPRELTDQRPEIGDPLPQVVNSDQKRNDAIRHLSADPDLVGTTIPEFASPLSMQRQTTPEFLQARFFLNICDHAFVGVTFTHNKRAFASPTF